MYNQVIFYNHFGAGDVFESREFVKAWMKIVPADSYHYSHGKHPKILRDIPNLNFKEITEHMKPMTGVWDDGNQNLYVNTWIGRDGKFVLPGIGCTVEKLFEMHNELLSVYNLGVLSGTSLDYIPDIDYSKYKIDKVDLFMKLHPEEKIFIDNGIVQSNQAMNFDMVGVVNSVAANHKDKCFIVSQPMPIREWNVYYSNEVTETPDFDLNELSYASTFCSTLIGRNSGPHVFTQVRKNVMDPKKKLLSFTYGAQGASFVVNSNVNIRRYWSDSTIDSDVIRKIEEVINE